MEIEDKDIMLWPRLVEAAKTINCDNVVHGNLHGDFQQVIVDKINDPPYIYVAPYNGDMGLYRKSDTVFTLQGNTYTHKEITLPDNLYWLFTSNLNCAIKNASGMPYGIGGYDRKYFNVKKTKLCFARFSTWTYGPRCRIREICEKKQDFIDCLFAESPSESSSNEDLHKFWEGISSSKFAICPPGNGPDTYRVWESLYHGTIPITLQNPIYDNFNLPILQIYSYKMLSENLLITFYEKIKNMKFDFDTLKLSYWLNKFKEKSNELKGI